MFGSGSVADTVALLLKAPAALIVAVTVMVTLAPEARLAIVQGRAAHPPPLTFVMVRFVGVSVTCTFVAVDGPALATKSVRSEERRVGKGWRVGRVLATETSDDVAAVPPLPVLSVLLARFGSNSFAETVEVLSNEPAALMVAVTLMVTFAHEARRVMVKGGAAQPPPLTFVMVMFDGVSVTCTFVAVDGPALATKSV